MTTETTHTEKELREVDAWIAEHVMGWKECVSPMAMTYPCFMSWGHGVMFYKNPFESNEFKPTTDPAAAMQVLEKCAERLLENEPSTGDCIQIQKYHDGWYVCSQLSSFKIVPEETLPVAICIFAKHLFIK